MTKTPSPPVHRRRVQSADVDVGGHLGAGTLLEWIESAAHATAIRWCDGVSVLASVGTFHLDHPVGIGAVVELRANLVHTGRSSMHVLVTIVIDHPAHRQTAQCPMVYVAIGNGGHPVTVPAWTPLTMLDLQRQRQARMRAITRKRIETAIAATDFRGSDTPCTTMRFRAGRADVNPDGTVRGGRVLRWIDEVAYVCGAAWTGSDVAVGYLAGIRCAEAISVGDAVDVTARIIHTGPRSVHCVVRCTGADAIGTRLLAEGLVVLVALEERGGARHIPQWLPGCEPDSLLDRQARELVHARQYIEPFTTVADHRRGA